MRLLALFSFTAYISLLLTPFAMAADSQEQINIFCKPEAYVLKYVVDEWTEEELDSYIKTTDEAYASSIDTDKCGLPHEETGNTLEKGDCTAAGKLVTEISETIGSEVKTEDNEIIDVYKGVCCLIGEYQKDGSNFECKDQRDVYFDTYENCTAGAVACDKRQWIISTSGAGIIKVYVKQIYRWAATTVGFVAVVTIVVSGIQISVSGVSGDITTAKNRILQSIGAIVLLFLSGLLLYTINPTFFS